MIAHAAAPTSTSVGDRIELTTIAAPVVALETFLAAAPAADAFVWAPPDGLACAGAGVAARLDVRGATRFTDLIAQAERLYARIDVSRDRSEGRTDRPPPRLYGGLAFAAGGAQAAPWEAFGDGSFVLPRVSYQTDGTRAWLTCAGRVDPAPILHALVAPRRHAAPSGTLRAGDARAWHARVDAIRAAIATGRFEKIVAARRCVVELGAQTTDLAVLERLAAVRGGTRFALRRDGATFLGATPERLVARRGLEVTTEALAGTIRSVTKGSGAGAALLASGKDGREHALVVREIARRLAPLCARVDVAPAPVIRELPYLLHLRTPISASLRAPTHVLALAEALHPTPATGGVPTGDAVAWIAAHEEPRGWYAGPIGWFDAAGDGELAVALRSGVLTQGRAHLYVGAGIIADSDPAAEWAETALKLEALLAALGVAA